MRRVLEVFMLWWAWSCAPWALAQEKPNFIIINVDDLGFADIGPFGSSNKTPNLARMAQEGRKLMSHYAAPVCSPSRASLMTGCYPKRVLPIPHVLFPASQVGLNPNEWTIAEVLKQVGYSTACIGKWHLGDQQSFLPTSQGFDYYFGIPYSNDMGPASEGSKSNPDKPLPSADEVAKKVAKSKQAVAPETGITGPIQPPLPLMENDNAVERVRVDGQFSFTKKYTERAVNYIREQKDKPFFLYLPHNAVHFPLYPSEDFRGKSPNGLLGDWVEEVDWSTGRILDVLRELKLDRRTLVIFTSDNGGPLSQGATNHPLRGGKGQTFEGGVRVVTIAWWPGKIPANTQSHGMTSMMDILPTFAKIAGAPLPADRKLDGVDVWPVLAGENDQKSPRDDFLYYRGFTLEAVRSGPWKLHLALADGASNSKKKAEATAQLFNVAEDMGETKDVSNEHPEIVQRLRAIADSTDQDLGSKDVGPGCRPLGRVDKALPVIDSDGKVRPDAIASQSVLP